MRNFFIIASVVVIFSGCSSTTTSFYNRSVVEDNIADVVSTVSLSSDRRTVVVAHKSANQEKPLFCAEPPPDTATGLKTDLDVTGKSRGGEGSLKDKLETSVTVLSARNAPLDAFRTGLFSLCQFYMNGAIQNTDVPVLFRELIEAYKTTQPVGTKLAEEIKLNAENKSAAAGAKQ